MIARSLEEYIAYCFSIFLRGCNQIKFFLNLTANVKIKMKQKNGIIYNPQ